MCLHADKAVEEVWTANAVHNHHILLIDNDHVHCIWDMIYNFLYIYTYIYPYVHTLCGIYTRPPQGAIATVGSEKGPVLRPVSCLILDVVTM